ncbi:MAG: hypothetical protein ABSG36_14570 [Acidimicrobiales bacterium]|jgi:hypothetical protein
MPVRKRLESDLDGCVQLAREVHESDGYPMYLPDDLAMFITAPGAFCAWVAEEDGERGGR